MKTVAKLFLIAYLFMSVVSFLDSDSGMDAFQVMIACRNEFNAALKTIITSTGSLTDRQCLENLVNRDAT